jgi:hypothetical protein
MFIKLPVAWKRSALSKDSCTENQALFSSDVEQLLAMYISMGCCIRLLPELFFHSRMTFPCKFCIKFLTEELFGFAHDDEHKDH